MKFSFALATTLLGLALVHAVPIGSQEIEQKKAQGLRLLRLGPDQDPIWKSEDEKLDLLRAGVKFFDVTEVWAIQQALPERKAAADVDFPPPSHQDAIKPILDTLSVDNMKANLDHLGTFNNRYYKSSTGQESAQYIFDTVSGFASKAQGVTVEKFDHSWSQFSIIAKIPGKSDGPITILGAHQDSINLEDPDNGKAPGQDDDGSGTVNNIEVFRALVESGFQPSTPVEIHWYSGEEAGLLGSQDIATAYAKKSAQVKAFMQLDMTAYFKPGSKEVIAVEADYVTEGVNTFTKSLISSYSSLPGVMNEPCGYACSDHASWHDQGFPTTMIFEAVNGDDNQKIHTPDDVQTLDGFSWTHSLEFAKVALSFVYELSA